jgi:hypothetical protein
MASVSPSESSDCNWHSDDASADERPPASAARDDHADAARNLLVFAADKAGMQVGGSVWVCGTIGSNTHLQGVDRDRVNKIINEASRGSACVLPDKTKLTKRFFSPR